MPPALEEIPIPPAGTDRLTSERQYVAHGSGEVVAGAGDLVTFEFAGRLPDGQVFVNSWETTRPTFALGDGNLMAGLDEQLRGLVAGDRVTILLGSDQGFGDESDRTGSVPPGSPLGYLVEVVEVVDAS